MNDITINIVLLFVMGKRHIILDMQSVIMVYKTVIYMFIFHFLFVYLYQINKTILIIHFI